MGRAPCCEKVGLKRGPWTSAEDRRLIHYIQTHGEGGWRELPKSAGLLRCGKSCRLRWFNYLRPDLKRGNITEEEEKLIIKLHALLGNRWSLIASRLPGRTDNEIKNHWNAHLKKRLLNNAIITTNAMQNAHGGSANYSRSSYNYMKSLDKYGDHHHYIMDGNGSTKCGGEYNNQLSPLQQVPDVVQLNLSYDTNNNNNNNPIPCNDARSGNVSPPEYSPRPAIVPLAPPNHPLPRVPSPPPAPHLPQLPSAAPSSPRVPHQPISGLQLAAPADQSVNGSGCYLLHQSLSSSSSSSTGHDHPHHHHHHHDDIACTYGNAHHDVTTCGDYNSAQEYSAANQEYHLHDLLLSADGLGAYGYINCDHLLIDDHRPRDDHDHHNSTSNCSTSFSGTSMSASDPRLVIINGDINYPIKFLSTPADCTISQSASQLEDYQPFLMQEDMQIMICTSSSVININRYDISPDSPVHSTSDTANVEYDPYAELWGNHHS